MPAPAGAGAGQPGPAAISPRQAAWLLAMLIGLQPLTTDLLLAALPAVAADLQAGKAPVQLVFAATILAFGVAQLVWGPVADRYGRRPVLLIGLTAYVVASGGALLAVSVEQLILWRGMQGAAMAASVVCARAMLRDLYEPHQGAGVMAAALTRVGLIAVLCPTLSGVFVTHLGWRSVFAVLLVAGLSLLAFVAWRLPETARHRYTESTRLAALLPQVLRILRHPGFRAWTLLVTCTYGALFVALAGAGITLIEVLQLSPTAAGAALSAMASCYIVGTAACRHWLPRHGLAGTVARGACFSLAGAVLMAAVAWFDTRSVWVLMLPMTLFSFGHGIHQPCGQAGAAAAFPESAGLASALSGFALSAAAFAISGWLGGAFDGTVRPLAGGMALGAGLTALVAWTLVRRHGEPRRPVEVADSAIAAVTAGSVGALAGGLISAQAAPAASAAAATPAAAAAAPTLATPATHPLS